MCPSRPQLAGRASDGWSFLRRLRVRLTKRMLVPGERRRRRDLLFAQGDEQRRRDQVGGRPGIASVVVGAKPFVNEPPAVNEQG